MLVAGVIMAFRSIGAVVGGLLGFIGMALVVAAVCLALYVGWRLLNSPSGAAKILGAFVLVLGVVAAFPAALTAVAGTVAAVVLAGKLVVIALLLYFGWRWVNSGDFSAPSRGAFRRGRW